MLDKKIIQYNPKLTLIAREFRNNPTVTEKILWERLKRKRIMGFDFHRQKPIGNYIVDFYCSRLMLAIEIDGPVHNLEFNMIKDIIRQDRIEQSGIQFLRFENHEIERNLESVINKIKDWIEENHK